ncbi:hypothetical protein HOLleu_40717 [Holothuria leucospilota]|uniref:Uncharacterized protein n=1 Tax=Holothuria leucospilota TaxID=206669 RepID=A0A9Q1BD16_HOLLE|nr:hypothetical protein HOLleu_40717 [Holothuria leucospilota]
MDSKPSSSNKPSVSRLSPNTDAGTAGTSSTTTTSGSGTSKVTPSVKPNVKDSTVAKTVMKNVRQKKNSPANIKDTASVAKRLDRLEGLLENFLSGFYDEDNTMGAQLPSQQNTTRLTVAERRVSADNDTEIAGFEDNPPATPLTENPKSESEGARDENIGFAARFATPADEGDNIASDLANSLNYLISTKLEDKQLTDTSELYTKPSNCHSLVVPKVNPQIWDNISPKARSLDLKIQRCQKPLVKGLTALTVSLSNKELTDLDQDALALLSNSIFEMNMLRKELIKPELQQKFSHLCKHTVKPTLWLFGDNLPKTVKDMEEEHKTVGVVRTPKINQRFNPILRLPQSDRQRYRQAGWQSTSHRSNFVPSQQPFLGVQRYPRLGYKDQTRDPRPSHNKGLKTKTTEKQFRRN